MNTQHQPPPDQNKRIRFDGTINAGHVLTSIGMLAAMAVGWNTLDARVVRLEEAKAYQFRRDDAQDVFITLKFGEIKDALKEVKEGVNELRRDGKK